MEGPHPSSAASSSSPSGGNGGSGPSIGLNLRVTGHSNQGGRKYMEDYFSVAYEQTPDESDLEYAFFGIFDGHGGAEAALFAKKHLMNSIVKQRSFWESEDSGVCRAIHEGFLATHAAMWRELDGWPKTASGLPSTAGTTASVAFIRRGKIYIGHVGDSAIVLALQDSSDPCAPWRPQALTREHKPESLEESKRIHESGGKVVSKSGVPRVVWNRPKMGHKGPVRRSTHIDEIPFLAVARSLGDLWSYNSEEDVFVVSPEPDTYVYDIDITKHRCLILGTDGVWNMISPAHAVAHVCQAEKSNEQHLLNPSLGKQWINPSKRLVDKAIERWNVNNLRADNTSVVTVMLDPPGPPRAQVLRRQLSMMNNGTRDISLYNERVNSDRGTFALVTNTEDQSPASSSCPVSPGTPLLPPLPSSSTPGGYRPPSSTVTSKSAASSNNSNNDAIQCNEISSSDDETSPARPPTPDTPPLPHRQSLQQQQTSRKKPILKPVRKLKRELNGLQFSSPGAKLTLATNINRPGRASRHRTISESNTSDTENEAQEINRSPKQDNGFRQLRSSGKKDIAPTNKGKKTCGRKSSRSSRTSEVAPSPESELKRLNDQLKNMQHKVAIKTLELNHEVKQIQHNLRSSPRTLRSGNSINTNPLTLPLPITSRKRKRGNIELGSSSSSSSSNFEPSPPSKSSKRVLESKKPIVVTRSRRARVLQLKK